MSTNSECSFVEVEKGTWYYALEDSDAPKDAWDWREYASAYGPFPSMEEALKHLDENHANPGGYSACGHEQFEMIDVWRKLIDDAPANTRAAGRFGW